MAECYGCGVHVDRHDCFVDAEMLMFCSLGCMQESADELDERLWR